MVIMNTQSGICKVKLWNRTLFAGRINSLDKLVQVCKENFGQGKPCSGFQLQAGDQTKYEGLLSLLPSPRKLAKDCHKFLRNNADDGDDMCPECKTLSKSHIVSDVSEVITSYFQKDEVILPKVEATEDKDHDFDFEESKAMVDEDNKGDNPFLEEADPEDEPMLDEEDLAPDIKQVTRLLGNKCPWCKQNIDI